METFSRPQSGKSQQISITELHHTTPECRFCFFFNEVFLFFKSFVVFLYGSLDRLGMTGRGLGRTGWAREDRKEIPDLVGNDEGGDDEGGDDEGSDGEGSDGEGSWRKP